MRINNLIPENTEGFGGEKPPSAQKVADLLKREQREDITIEVDGNITPENAAKLRKIGASVFVAGTSAIFKGNVAEYKDNINNFRKAIL